MCWYRKTEDGDCELCLACHEIRMAEELVYPRKTIDLGGECDHDESAAIEAVEEVGNGS